MATTTNISNIFTTKECDFIQKLMHQSAIETAKVEVNEQYVENVNFRRWYMLQLWYDNKYKWLFERVYLCVKKINLRFYKYDLSYNLEKVTLLKYQTWDFFESHNDLSPGWWKKRKLSIIIPLSNPNDYIGGELYSQSIQKTFSNEQWSIIVFPSTLDHEVKQIISWERYTLVAWFNSKN